MRLDAEARRAEIDVSRKAQQFHRVAELLKSFNEKGIPTQLVVEARDIERREEQQRAADRTIVADLRKLADLMPSDMKKSWKPPVDEILKALETAPEMVRDRLAAWRKVKSQATAATTQRHSALAMSGYVAGLELASPDMKIAEMLWKARDLVRAFLGSNEESARVDLLDQLDSLAWGDLQAATDMTRRLEILTRIIQLMPPPLSDVATEVEKTKLHRVLGEQDETPTEYAVRLPPEYDPIRSYPALVVMHSGDGPNKALDQWEAEGSRRGYILVAPEYSEQGRSPEYRYTMSEHAAVELTLRDLRKRYAVDSDRVFAAGQLTGANMAWDYALAHSDEFAGVVVISGLPAKYVPRYLPHHERLPLFYVVGEYVPAASKFIYEKFIKPLIQKTWDITYIEYFRRGLEELPEEIGPAFDWMDRHRRDPYPRAFKAVTARTSDDRFNGFVIKEFSPGRTIAPEAADVLGQNLNPATIEMKSSRPSNLIRLEVNGIKSLEVWLSPKLVDFKRRVEIRVQDRPYFKSQVKLSCEPMLEDLRVRGDRQQLYWYRVPAR